MGSMMTPKRVLLLVFLLAGPILLGAEMPQQPHATTALTEWRFGDEVIESWSNSLDGLPSNKVVALAQTLDGYLWVGTTGGLARFDGARFVLYGEREGCSQISVVKLMALPSGGLWMRNEVGETFLIHGGRFIRDERNFRGVVNGRDGQLYGYDRTHIVRLTESGGTKGERIELPADARIENRSVNCGVEIESDGKIWYWNNDLSSVEVWMRPPQGWQRRTSFDGEKALDQFGDSRVQLKIDSKGAVWLGTSRGVILKKDQGPCEIFNYGALARNGLSFLESDAQGTMWAGGTVNGIYRYQDNQFSPFPLVSTGKEPVALAMLTGRDGEVWIGTETDGLFRIKPTEVKFCRTPQVMALHVEDTSRVLVGTIGQGIYRWEAGRLSRYAKEAGFDDRFTFGRAFLKSRDNTLWTATGLNEFKDGVRLTNDAFSSIFGEVFALSERADGAIWAGCTVGRLYLIQDHHPKRVNFPMVSTICSLEYDNKGRLWVATLRGGVWRLEADETTWTTIPWAEGIPKAQIMELFVDSQGDVWVGTQGMGLYRWAGKEFVRIIGETGLDNGMQIQEDRDGWLWVGTMKGICGIDVAGVRQGKREMPPLLWLKREDGVLDEQCTRLKAARDQNGNLYFGTTRGFVTFDPLKVKSNHRLPRPVLEELEINDASPISLVDVSKPVEIPPGARFNLQFSGLAPALLKQIMFRYRILGMEQQWTESGGRRVVDFIGIPPGSYRFEVQAGAKGKWNPEPAVLNLQVRPFYWQTWWFRAAGVLLGVVVIMLLFWAVHRRRMHVFQAALERKHAVNVERERIARDLHDGLGAGLTKARLLATDLKDATERSGSPTQLENHLHSLALELDAAVWMTNPSYDQIPELCDYLAVYAQEFLKPAGIQYTLNMEGPLPQVEISPEVRHHLFQTVKEVLNNIVKHSAATQAWLEIKAVEAGLLISIRDNGHGFDLETAMKKGRHGLSALRKRVEAINGQLRITSGASGTIVEITLSLPPGGRPKEAEREGLFQY